MMTEHYKSGIFLRKIHPEEFDTYNKGNQPFNFISCSWCHNNKLLVIITVSTFTTDIISVIGISIKLLIGTTLLGMVTIFYWE